MPACICNNGANNGKNNPKIRHNLCGTAYSRNDIYVLRPPVGHGYKRQRMADGYRTYGISHICIYDCGRLSAHKRCKKYAKRLLIGGIISEIPYNLMVAGGVFFPFQQNVMWTLLMGLLLICFIERADKKDKPILTILAWLVAVVAALVLGTVSMCDYGAVGVLTVLMFYLFRYRNIWCYAGRLAAMLYFNIELLSGMYYVVEIFGKEVEITRQGFAVFSLIFIWPYNGKKGYSAKWFQYFNYLFYPAHMLLLSLIAIYR